MYSGPPGGVYYTNQGLVNHTEEQEGAGPSAYPSNVYFAGAEAAPPVFFQQPVQSNAYFAGGYQPPGPPPGMEAMTHMHPHFAGGYQPSGPPPGMDAMTHMHSQFHASPFQTTMPDQVLSSASVASHVDQIESMCIGESRRPLGHIREMIDSAKGSTQSRGLPGNRVELQTYRTDASMFSFESEFDAGSNTLQIKQSFRTISSRNRNGPYPNASDVYLGQLCKLQERKTGRDELPNRLPENIVRHRICNDQTKNVVREMASAVGPEFTLRLDRANPDSIQNERLHRLISDTPNGKSTAHMVKDFNNLKGTEYVITSAEVTQAPLTIVFKAEDPNIIASSGRRSGGRDSNCTVS